MKICITVDTETSSVALDPVTDEIVDWVITSLPIAMGSYYGAFVDIFNTHFPDKKIPIQDISARSMEFMKSALNAIKKENISNNGEMAVEGDISGKSFVPPELMKALAGSGKKEDIIDAKITEVKRN